METIVPWMTPAIALVVGYLLGSIPFGVLLTRMFGAGDLRAVGSGNIGATNVLRTGRRTLAAATLVGDLLKGLAAVLIAGALGEGLGPLGAVAVVVGHCLSRVAELSRRQGRGDADGRDHGVELAGGPGLRRRVAGHDRGNAVVVVGWPACWQRSACRSRSPCSRSGER